MLHFCGPIKKMLQVIPLTVKLILIGDSAVGKSTMFDIYRDGGKSSGREHQPTIGVDFYTSTRSLAVNNKLYEITYQIWDTAGQERFRAVSANYFRNIDGVLFVFEAPKDEFEQSYKSLRNVDSWYDFAKQNTDPELRDRLVHAVCMTKLDQIQHNETLQTHVGNQCKVTLEKVCSQEVDIKRVFKVTREKPENILKMFDYLLKYIAETKIKSMPNETTLYDTNIYKAPPRRRRSQQKMFVVSVLDKDSSSNSGNTNGRSSSSSSVDLTDTELMKRDEEDSSKCCA